MKYISCKSESSLIICDFQKNDTIRKSVKIRKFLFEELKNATNNFSNDNLLGKGSHGSVYVAIIGNGKLKVAVKRVSDSISFRNSGENEIKILSKIQNPFIINMLGFTCDKKLIVYEFMKNGSLYNHLHGRTQTPSWAKRIKFALQIAKALENLHLLIPPVIHRDIKSSNVLIDANWNAKLADFGLAFRGNIEDIRVKSTPPAGTLGYLDPDYIVPENLSTKSDVFSFGILLLEIISGRNAIDMNYSPSSVIDWAIPIIKKGEYMTLFDPRIKPPEDYTIVEQTAILAALCVRPTSEKRPSMTKVVNFLKVLNKKVSLGMWDNLMKKVKLQRVSIQSKEGNRSENMVWLDGPKILRNRSKVSDVCLHIENERYKECEDTTCSVSTGSVLSSTDENVEANPVCRELIRVDKGPMNMIRAECIVSGMSRNDFLVLNSQIWCMFKLVKNPYNKNLYVSMLMGIVQKGFLRNIVQKRHSYLLKG